MVHQENLINASTGRIYEIQKGLTKGKIAYHTVKYSEDDKIEGLLLPICAVKYRVKGVVLLPAKASSTKVFTCIKDMLENGADNMKDLVAALCLPRENEDLAIEMLELKYKTGFIDRVLVFDDNVFRNKHGELSQSKALETMASHLLQMMTKSAAVSATEFVDITADQAGDKRKNNNNSRGRGGKRGRGRFRGRGGY